MGLGWKHEDIATMREACANDRGVPWLMADITRFEGPRVAGQGEAMVERAKEVLRELERDGKMGVDGFFLF